MKSNEELISHLIDIGNLKSERIINAMRAIDRINYVPDGMKDVVYEDASITIGNGQRTTQPFLVALILEYADIRGGEKILEIGSGAGWLLSLMAHLNHQSEDVENLVQGEILSVEIFPEVADIARENIKRNKLFSPKEIQIYVGDGKEGFPKGAPFHKIITTAAVVEVPQAWKDQLIIGGKIIFPTPTSLVVLQKEGKDDFQKKEYFGFVFDRMLQ